MKLVVKCIVIACILSNLLGFFYANNFVSTIYAATTEITKEEAQQKLEERFSSYDIESIEYLSEEDSSSMPTYNFKVKFKDADEFCAQVTKKNGRILTIGCTAQSIPSFIEKQQCLKSVEQFVHGLGFKNLVAIWSTTINDETIVNLAPVIKNVIIYPDLLKVRVNCKTGEILSLEARTYLYDFYKADKSINPPKITIEEAKKKVEEGFLIDGYRLAMIEDPEDNICLTYEIKAKKDNLTYYFYVNATDGTLEEVVTSIE